MLTILAHFVIPLTLVGVAVGRYPWLRMNRATIALVGATLLIVVGAISLEEAYAALDLDTLTLLFAMMVINVNLRLAGFFQLVGRRLARWARTPRQLLAWIIVASGVLSAIFLNDTIVLMFTPLVLEITAALRRNPIPYLVGLVSAANIGSTATITGNPQNMIIGIASGISYLQFAAALTPIALLGLGTIWLVLVLFYPAEFSSGHFDRVEVPNPRIFRPLLTKSLIVTGGLLVAFILGVPIAEAAFVAATILLFTRRVHPEKVMNEVDWNLLVFFAALFILTGVIELNHLTDGIFAALAPFLQKGAAGLSLITVIMSNLVSNVPAVLLLRPAVAHLADPTAGWLTLAAASTLAGNLTLLGSVANLIVAESAAKRGIKLTFWEYTRAGIIITLLSLVIGIGWIQLFIWK